MSEEYKESKLHKILNWFKIDRKTVIYIIISLIIGSVIRPYLEERIKLFINRPCLSVKFQKIELNEHKTENWELVSYFKLTNIGNSSTLANINSLEILFPGYSNKPFNFKLDESMKISRKESIDDTILISIPIKFRVNSSKDIPVIKKIKLYISQNGEEEYPITTDSTDIEKMSYFEHIDFREKSQENLPKDVFYNSATSTYNLKITSKRFYINYKGKNYANYIYPPETKVNYEIRNDSIILLPIYGDKLSVDSLVYLRPFHFTLNAEIIDKIIVPEKYELKIGIETIKKEKKDYEEISIDMDKFFGKYKKQIVYYFKN